MKKLQYVSFVTLALSMLLWTAGRTVLSLPDWAVRLNGAMMLIVMPLLVFSSVRQKVKNS